MPHRQNLATLQNRMPVKNRKGKHRLKSSPRWLGRGWRETKKKDFQRPFIKERPDLKQCCFHVCWCLAKCRDTVTKLSSILSKACVGFVSIVCEENDACADMQLTQMDLSKTQSGGKVCTNNKGLGIPQEEFWPPFGATSPMEITVHCPIAASWSF